MDKRKICVTGGSSYLGSYLIKDLLNKGYTVHATLRDLGEEVKVGLLKSLPFAESRLVLFQADIYNPPEFFPAVRGCRTVVHVATPLQHDSRSSKYKNTTEAAVAGVKSIVDACIKSGMVKRLVYTASVVAASALKEDGSGYKDSMDEACWTPFNLSYPYSMDFLDAYVYSKTLAEKEALKCNDEHDGLEVVSLAFGLIGGDTIQPWPASSLKVLISQGIPDESSYKVLRFLEELVGKVPILHIEDVSAAFIFCIETEGLKGRYLCASDLVKSAEIASILQCSFPGTIIPNEFIEDTKRELKWGSSKLEEMGFKYKYNAKMIVEESLQCFKKFEENV